MHLPPVFLANLLQETPVDVVNDLHVTREQLLNEGHRPALQRLGEHRVICEGEDLWRGDRRGVGVTI